MTRTPDPRFSAWLEIARETANAPDAELAERLASACERRAELASSLREEPPDPRRWPDEGLSRELAEVERALASRAAELLAAVRAKVAQVREVRSGTRGYKQARENPPALLSRSA